MFLTVVVLSSCAGTRYQLGWNAGYRSYKKAAKTGYVKHSYGVGFVEGFSFGKSMDDLDKSAKALDKIIKEIDAADKKRKEDFKELLELSTPAKVTAEVIAK